MEVKCYEDWLNESGYSVNVQKKRFVTYEYDEQGKKVFKSKDGSKYVCAHYECVFPDRTVEIVRFREDYIPARIFAVERDVGWSFSSYEESDFDIDGIPDEITCTREEVDEYRKSGKRLKRIRFSKELQRLTNEDRATLFILNKMLKDSSLAHLREAILTTICFRETPTISTMKDLIRHKKSHPDLYEEMWQIIENNEKGLDR